MRKENRGSRPAGERPKKANRPSGERAGKKRVLASGKSVRTKRTEEGTAGSRSVRTLGRSAQSAAPGDRRPVRGPSGRPGVGSTAAPGKIRCSRSSGDFAAGSSRNPADRGGRPGRTENSARKVILKRNQRPPKSQLLKELGYSPDYRVPRGELHRRTDAGVPGMKSDLIRLNRFIANAGICSRREADKYISAGVVMVNGQVVTELGTKVSPDDEVRFDGRLITPERKVYLLLNKPKDFVTTTDDPHAEHTVMDLIKNACEERIYPVGRLDRNTTGLLLFTNDGEMAKRLSHPSHRVEKIYQVTLDKNVSVADVQKIAGGIELEDGFIAADSITYVEGADKNVVGLEIHSGRQRIVRRIFEQLGYRVKALDRVSYAGLTKKNLPRGKWRFLSPPEVSFLKMK